MPSNSPMRGRCARTALLAGLLLSPVMIGAQRASQNQIMATAVLNLAVFLRWPPGAIQRSGTPISFCVVGHGVTGRELDRLAADQKIGLHPVEVRHVQPGEGFTGCHLVFLGDDAEKLQLPIIRSTHGQPIVLVAELSGFAARGGTLDLHLVNNRVMIEVNLETAEQSNIRIDARLLAQAQVVRWPERKQEP
jgi:hypothetical protein